MAHKPLIEFLKPLSALTRQDFTWPKRATRRQIHRYANQYNKRRRQIVACYEKIHEQLRTERFKAAGEAGLTTDERYMGLWTGAIQQYLRGRPWPNVDYKKATRIKCCDAIHAMAHDIFANWCQRNDPQYFYYIDKLGTVIRERPIRGVNGCFYW